MAEGRFGMVSFTFRYGMCGERNDRTSSGEESPVVTVKGILLRAVLEWGIFF